jgi:hypothetical protein
MFVTKAASFLIPLSEALEKSVIVHKVGNIWQMEFENVADCWTFTWRWGRW